MKFRKLCVQIFFVVGLAATIAFSQTIPDDPNHLPTKIGGDPGSRAGSIMVAGKVSLVGLPNGQPKPTIYVAAYFKGGFVGRRQVSENGSYTINDIPKQGTTLVVEIDHTEVANRLLELTIASIVYQDFSVNWTQSMDAKSKPGVVSATYERSKGNQDRFDKAIVDFNKGNYDSAITNFKTVVNADKKDYYAWTQLGNAYFLKKDEKSAREAEAAYLHAISENAGYTLASVNLGKLYLALHENDKAIERLTKAVESEPASPDAQQYMGEAYLAIKKGSKAVGYLNEAIRLAPIEKAEVHLRLADLYKAAGIKPRASAEYQKFLEKVPNYEHRDDLIKYIAENPPGQ